MTTRTFVLATADVRGFTQRVYPREILERLVRHTKLFGHFDRSLEKPDDVMHLDGSFISHTAREFRMEGNSLLCDITTRQSARGRELEERLQQTPRPVVFVLSGIAKLGYRDHVVDFEFGTVDAVTRDSQMQHWITDIELNAIDSVFAEHGVTSGKIVCTDAEPHMACLYCGGDYKTSNLANNKKYIIPYRRYQESIRAGKFLTPAEFDHLLKSERQNTWAPYTTV